VKLLLTLLVVFASTFAAEAQPRAESAEPPPPSQFRALVFSKTAGFRHRDSIPPAIAAIRQLGQANNFAVTATEDAAAFTDASLRTYEVVIFLLTTGDVLNAEQQAAFERYVRAGGGYVGVHSAADTEYAWEWYGRLLGAYFKNHPQRQTAVVERIDPLHPSTRRLPGRWQRFDEWYNYRSNPRPSVHVLATVDESTYEGGSMGSDHPIAWCHDFEGGRSWYTGLGHTAETYSERLFRGHLLGGIRYAAGFPRRSTITGTARADNVACTPGHDRVRAGAGADIVDPGGGSDIVYGGRGNDSVSGRRGNDVLYGGPGRDTLSGGPGNDLVHGGPGADTLACGTGRDRVIRDRLDTVARGCEIVRTVG